MTHLEVYSILSTLIRIFDAGKGQELLFPNPALFTNAEVDRRVAEARLEFIQQASKEST